jgi:hypothetical protein
LPTLTPNCDTSLTGICATRRSVAFAKISPAREVTREASRRAAPATNAEVWRYIAPFIVGRSRAVGEQFFQRHSWKGLNPNIVLVKARR